MIPKLIAVVVGFLILGLASYFIFVNTAKRPPQTLQTATSSAEVNLDFGDAPDGKSNSQFPSLLVSDGARTKKTDDVWLGQTVTGEKDSKQIDLDEADDGVKLNLNSCKQSTAYFFVHIKNPGKISGTAYLNLYADWNSDGKWSGGDACGQEWAVQNYPIDLSKQTNEIAVYAPLFTAGESTEKIWYRGSVTLDQKMNEASTGEFASGEVEDYGPHSPGDGKYYNFYCMPDPLIIKHGSKGNIKILPDLFSEPIFDVQFGEKYNPRDFKRQVTILKQTFTFESSNKDVDPPKRNVPHLVDLRVRFGKEGKEAVLEKSCTVIVEHDELTIETPSRRTFPVPSASGSIKTKSPANPALPTSSPVQEENHPIQETPGLLKN